MNIIDFHSHVLPAVDDGSRDIDTSIKILQISKMENEIDKMIATPHFYAHRDRTERFLARRENSYERLMETLRKQEHLAPEIILGAEVAYFPGIATSDAVEKLTVQGTNVLLLEMPFSNWTKDTMKEVRTLSENGRIQIVLAHIERFYHIPDNAKNIKQILEYPLLTQVNADSIIDWRQRHRVIKLFKAKKAHLLGSDCHGLHSRPQNLKDGRNILAKKCGEDILKQIDILSNELLER